ncbi:MAG: ribbon-helix-helix domain-containing protein [Gammaproteobacteria bacterium]|nr:ribbon-helix-helix domain-containing protein [Gammaproteobacteria bacterium]MDD9822337.1 ribbon-helix-helix domain-containing protein [Gammaproteobacteria bacterium]MDD9885041.1 ribbon-helix-helix domain-containing protein [Gammaproteobacteria bacterium]
MSTSYTIRLSDEIDERLTDIARERKISKAEAMTRAFALLSFAVDEEKQGHFVASLKPSDSGKPEVVKEVVGL